MKSTDLPASTLTSASYEELVREMLIRLGEDPDREGLSRTPARVEKAMQFLVKGYIPTFPHDWKAACLTSSR